MTGDLGRLDRRVQFQRLDRTVLNTYGEPDDTAWQDLGDARWASRYPISAARALRFYRVVRPPNREGVLWIVRWASDLADLSPQDRLVYGSVGVAESPSNPAQYYDITSVHEIGAHHGIKIISERTVVT